MNTAGGIFIRTVRSVMHHFECDAETAQRYIDLRDEGYPMYQARVMAGLADPPGDDSRPLPRGAADNASPSEPESAIKE